MARESWGWTPTQARDRVGVARDISGLEIVDSCMARALNDAAKRVRLLAPKAVICGVLLVVATTR